MHAELEGVKFETHPDVYDPHDDSQLLMQNVRASRGQRFLDLGCGTGVVGIHAALQGARVVCADLNPEAVRLARSNARLNHVEIDAVQANLSSSFQLSRFDVVAFNPPYLPTTPRERIPGPINRAFDGGATGTHVLNKFLDSCANDPPRAIIVLASTLQGPDPVLGPAARRGLRGWVVASKQLSFETLIVFALRAEPE